MSNGIHSAVDAVINNRRSVRAFSDSPVSADVLNNVLEVASRAPSGCNMQPWRVYVLTGEALRRVTDAVCHAYDYESGRHITEFQHAPDAYFEPYQSRRRKMGFAMYGLVGIDKGDKERMHMQQRLNFEFFGAPVGMFFTLHRDLPVASLIGYGAFLQNVMLSAEGHGMGSCFQTGWCDYHTVVSRELNFGNEETLIGGMALGYADMDAPINQLCTERVPLSAFSIFHRE